MLDLYRLTARYVRASFPLLVLIALIFAVADHFLSSAAASGATLIAHILLIHMFHGHFLYGDAPLGLATGPKQKRPFGRFLLVNLALLVLPVIAAILCAIALGLPSDRPFAILALVIVFYGLAIGFFGTALPASIDRDPRYRTRMGMRHVTRTLGLLVAGPVVVLVFTMIGIFGINAIVPFDLSAPLTGIAFGTVATFLGFFSSALAAGVLCKVYREILSDAAPPQPA